MKVFDCTYINSAGGKKILEIILDKIPDDKLRDYFFLLDSRISLNDFSKLKNTRHQFILNSEIKRRSYYKSVKDKIEKCICLANVPPPININCEVIIFFHNDLILKPRLSLSIINLFTFFLKKKLYKVYQFRQL